MRVCRIVEVLSRLLPVQSWKGNILDRHAERCPSCQAKLAVRDEARPCVMEPRAVEPSGSLWPAVEAGIRVSSPEPGRRTSPAKLLRKISAGVAAVAAALALVMLVFQPRRPTRTAPREAFVEDFRLDSVEAMGRPARALIYQPRDSGITIIWVQ